MQLDTDISLSNTGALPSADFTFSDAISGLWGGLKPVVQTGIQTWGSVQIAEANASAQAKLNALKTQNATLGSNQPAAAQQVANQTLAQQYLPNFASGAGGSVIKWVVLAVVVVGAFWIIRRLLRK